MPHQPLDFVPLWILFLAALVLALLAMELGYQFGWWRHAHSAEEKVSSVGAMVGSILGLMAFMLAFTFGLAANRFDARREAVLAEANAIGTTYLRSRLLPEAQRGETARMLREYVDVRVRGIQENKVAEAIVRSEQLHASLWSAAVKAAENKSANPVMTSLFIQSLNETIDIHAKRLLVGARSRIPASIWIGLIGLSVLSMAAVGYQAGLAATRRSPAMAGLIVAFASVLFLIADLDRGAEGFLRVSQQALIDLQSSMMAAPE